jgi:hypothetical protein
MAVFGDLLPDGTDWREGLVLSDPAIRHSMDGGAGLARCGRSERPSKLDRKSIAPGILKIERGKSGGRFSVSLGDIV